MKKYLANSRKTNTLVPLLCITTIVAVGAILYWLSQTGPVYPNEPCGWGDNAGGRRDYTNEEAANGVIGEQIIFNSISDGTIGHEKNYVGARENTGINAGKDNIWYGNSILIEDGKEYLVRLYVHNDNPNPSAVATGVRVAFNIPTYSSTKIPVHGFIFSDNATPSEYWDGVAFESEVPFHLEYMYGSALMQNNGYASAKNGGGKMLSDEIVTKAASEHGVAIGYIEDGDGLIPGGYESACYIAIRVKAVLD